MRSAPNSPKLCCAVSWGCPGIWWYMWTAQGTLAPYWGRAHAVVRAGAAWAANGAAGAAQCELFQCLCAQPKLLRLNKPTQNIHSCPKLGLADAESLRIRV